MRNRFDRNLNVQRRGRRGFTLIELLLAIGILTMCVVALGMMARAVEISTEFNQGYGTAALHAQVAFDRISRAVSGASNNATYAGTWVTSDTVSSYTFPDTLIVWRPSSGTPVNPTGAPLASELVLFCPDPSAPNQLVEITVPSDTRTLPPTSPSSTFKSFIDGLKTESGVQKTLLTDLMRTATDSANTLRGCVRFHVTLNPERYRHQFVSVGNHYLGQCAVGARNLEYEYRHAAGVGANGIANDSRRKFAGHQIDGAATGAVFWLGDL